ncbi:MAG: hypothetical protein AAF307_05460 [Pseudomonadota bacterium]
MENAPDTVLTRLRSWPDAARAAFQTCRAIFHAVADEAKLGALEESLKWGQPAWRPKRPRTGATLRMSWDPATPEHLLLFVDCKTDLAARMQHLYPDLPVNDGRRQMAVSLEQALPSQALRHLAEMTFAYHLDRRRG